MAPWRHLGEKLCKPLGLVPPQLLAALLDSEKFDHQCLLVGQSHHTLVLLHHTKVMSLPYHTMEMPLPYHGSVLIIPYHNLPYHDGAHQWWDMVVW